MALRRRFVLVGMSQALLKFGGGGLLGFGFYAAISGCLDGAEGVVEGEHQSGHFPEASHPSEAPFGVEQGSTQPALDHLPAAFSANVTETPGPCGISVGRGGGER